MTDQTVSPPAAERDPDGLDDADDFFVIGEKSCGWPGTDLMSKPQPAVEPEPERRTVTLERLTPALVDEEDQRRRVEAREQGVSHELIPAEAKVAIVARINGLAAGILDTDTEWMATGADLLVAMLRSASDFAADGEAELLMPTPDVLAALDGRPDAGLWTGWVPVVYRTVQPGWQVMTVPPGPADPTPELVADTASCDVNGCENGVDCVVLTLPSGKVHMTSWRSVHVRIPAAVTA